MDTVTTEYLLRLVRQALDEFDDRPLDVSIRRAVRIASLVGESQTAVRLSLELNPIGGHRGANAEDTRRLMTDRSAWGDPDGPVERALAEFAEDRRIGPDKLSGHSIAQTQRWLDLMTEEDVSNKELFEMRATAKEILDRARHRTFTALCEWERRFSFGVTTQSLFDGFHDRVLRQLAAGAPRLIEQFNAVWSRIREARRENPQGEATEELAQAVTTCRRILKAVIDHVLPGEHGLLSEDGHVLDDEKYRNRLHEFTKRAMASESRTEALVGSLAGLNERFKALDGLASKGVHADVAMDEAESCAINTFIVAGEILEANDRLTANRTSQKT